MNTTNTINVVADSQPDADSTLPSRHGTRAIAIELSALCVPTLRLGILAVNKQDGISRLHTTRSGDILWQVSRTRRQPTRQAAHRKAIAHRVWYSLFLVGLPDLGSE